jgi:hypothetical protein
MDRSQWLKWASRRLANEKSVPSGECASQARQCSNCAGEIGRAEAGAAQAAAGKAAAAQVDMLEAATAQVLFVVCARQIATRVFRLTRRLAR